MNGISSNYLSYYDGKIDEMKETSGNRDVSNGGTSGATAASAIAAMQEAGSKLSRDMNKAAYRTYRSLIYYVIELIRQFYTVPRTFRIVGAKDNVQFATLDNSNLGKMKIGEVFGDDAGYRTPFFDIEVTAEKSSPYVKASNNELALQLYRCDFFHPANTEASLACLEIMDFDKKDEVIEKVKANGTMYQQIKMLQKQVSDLSAIVDAQNGTKFSAVAGGGPVNPMTNPKAEGVNKVIGKGDIEQESAITKNARKRVADDSAPR